MVTNISYCQTQQNQQQGSMSAPMVQGQVKLDVTHSNLTSTFPEIRFLLTSTIQEIKEQLWQRTGTQPQYMTLSLYNTQGQLLFTNLQDYLPLGHYQPDVGYRLHVVDTDPQSLSAAGGLETLADVPKYVMSEQEYDQRPNTLRKFKENLLAQQAAVQQSEQGQSEGTAEQREAEGKSAGIDLSAVNGDWVAGERVGQRCQVEPGARRGVVRFVGPVPSLQSGLWVGVQFDEPVGRHDGTVDDIRYFTCTDGFGAMVRGKNVTVGDFPPYDDFQLDSDDEL